MSDNTLQLAWLQKTAANLFEAVFHKKRDAAQGVSECIILAQSVITGMAALKVAQRLMIDPRNLVARRLAFQEAYPQMCRHPNKKLGRGRRLSRPHWLFLFVEF